MHLFTNLYTIQWMDISMDSYVVEITTIIEIISQGNQYHKQSYRGGGWWGATKWQNLQILRKLYGQMVLIQVVFSSTYHKM